MLNFVLNTLGQILYPLFAVVFLFIQVLQKLFYGFAGMGIIYYDGRSITSGNTGALEDTGIIYYLLNSSTIKNALISMSTLALLLLIIFTALAFIKNVYVSKPKSWQEIVGNAFKGLMNFILVPACCLFGVWLGNILLQAINSATSSTGSQHLDRKLFVAAAYNANRFRQKEEYDASGKETLVISDSDYQWLVNEANTRKIIDGSGNKGETYITKNPIQTGQMYSYYANYIDEMYANSDANIYSWSGANHGYIIWDINMLVIVVGGVFMCTVLISLAYAMVRRMFLILMLFVVSPGVCSLYPLDEGKAVGSWKSEFIKQVISVYAAVVGINLFFAVMPLIDKITIFTASGWLDSIVQILILTIGLFTVKEFVASITSWIGGEDVISKGASVRKQAKDAVTSRAKKAVTAGAFAFGNASNAKGFLGKTGSFFGTLGNEVLKSTTGLDVMKGIDKSKGKSGAEGYSSFVEGMTGGTEYGKARKEGTDAAKERGKESFKQAEIKQTESNFFAEHGIKDKKDLTTASNEVKAQYFEAMSGAGQDADKIYKAIGGGKDPQNIAAAKEAVRQGNKEIANKNNISADADEKIYIANNAIEESKQIEAKIADEQALERIVKAIDDLQDAISDKGGKDQLQGIYENLLTGVKITNDQRNVIASAGGQEVLKNYDTVVERNGGARADLNELNSSLAEAQNRQKQAVQEATNAIQNLARAMQQEITDIDGLRKAFTDADRGISSASKAVEEFGKEISNSAKQQKKNNNNQNGTK